MIIIPRSQSTSSQSKSSFYAKPRQTLATWCLEFVWTTRKRFWQSTHHVRFITDTLSRNFSLYDSKCYRCGSSAGKYKATWRKRRRTNWEHDYNAWKKAVNHEFVFANGNPKEFYGWAKTTDVGASVWEIHHWSSFMYRKVRFKTQVTTCSEFPSEAMLWITEAERVDSVDE